MGDQSKYDLARVVAVGMFIIQSVVTAAIGQFRADLGLTPFWVAVLSLVNVGIGAYILASPRVQGDGKKRED